MRPFCLGSLLLVAASLLGCGSPSSRPDSGAPDRPPSITSVAPGSGPVAGGTSVTVSGANFVTGASVRFGNVPGDAVAVVSASLLTVRAPAARAAGRVGVTVINPDGRFATLSDAFNYESIAGAIDEAVLTTGADGTDTSGAPTVRAVVQAQVQVARVTVGAGQGPGVLGQVGFATAVSNPPTHTDFTWSDATYWSDADGMTPGDKARDVYRGEVALPGATSAGPRVYLLAARFSVDNGATWLIADRDGAKNGVTQGQLGRISLTVPSVDWCKLGGETVEAPPVVNLGDTGTGPVVLGQVYRFGVTDRSGAGVTLRGQLGYGSPGTDPSTWRWDDATYERDSSGGSNDEYRAQLANPGLGTWKFAYRFASGTGPWAYCDADGLAAGGFSEAQAGTLNVTTQGIESCNLQWPPSITIRQGLDAGQVYGRVFAPGITDGGVPSSNVDAELGFGPAADSPSSGSWRWKAAAFNVKVAGGGEEFSSQLTGPSPGSYIYAYRFRYRGGSWAYCDLDGSGNGFSAGSAGQLTSRPLGVDACLLQHPPALNTREGRDAGLVFGRVWAAGYTDGPNPSTAVEAQLGLGPPADSPESSSWRFWPASYNLKASGGGEEYMAPLVGPTPGAYVYGYRFRIQSGAWAYCDLDGDGNGFTSGDAGQLTARPFDVDQCALDGPSSTQTTTPSGSTRPVLMQVTALTLTEVTGQGPGIVAEAGFGATGTPPSQWTTWSPATFDGDQDATDRYRATLVAPTGVGTYELAYRTRLGSNPWVYCDRDGSQNGYTSAQAGRLTVGTTAIQSCRLQYVSETSAASGTPITGYVRVLVPGVSGDAGLTPGLRAQIGVGTQGDNASQSASWGWKEATFNIDVGQEDELWQTIHPAYTGARAVAARASLDDGRSWVYCDTDGSENGYDPSLQWGLTVAPHADFAWCNTQWPPQADAGTNVYGRASKAGLTPDASAPITAALGIGLEREDPGLAWRWLPGTFNQTHGDNSNEYMAPLPRADAGLNFAWRFTLDGGSFCFGDLNASSDGFSGRSGGTLNVGEIVP